MGNSSHFTGQPIFNQLLSLIPRNMVRSYAKTLQCDRYCKHFGSYEHLVTMLYGVFNRCSSLREIICGMQVCNTRLCHMGIRVTPRRSTLSDANNRRSHEFFDRVYHGLYQKYFKHLPDSMQESAWLNRMYIIDSTTISLFSEVMQGAGSYRKSGRKKGGIKAHLCISARHDCAAFVCLTEAKANDNSFLPKLHLPQGSVVVFDKGYRNYQKLIAWNEQGTTWVTRLSKRLVYQVSETLSLTNDDIEAGIKADQLIVLGNPQTEHRNALQQARLIEYTDPQTGKCLQFITNNKVFSAATVAGIYRRRWQIELLFKRIKSAFQFHFFVGDSENAIRIQLWCALIADLLLQIVKRTITGTKAKWSMANLTAIVRLHLTTYVSLIEFLKAPEKALIGYTENLNIQPSLFPT
jgi:hypothetical protein